MSKQELSLRQKPGELTQAPAQPTFEQMKLMAQSIAKSKLFGVTDPDQALSLMLIAAAEGRSPALAARDYFVIQGRPTLKADTMLSRFQSAGGKVDWKEYTDTKVVGVFSHPQAGSVTIEWTMEQAKRAGLASKDVWKSYPRAMLRSRCISEGVRTCFPGIAVGVYTPEEIESGEIDITPPRTPGELERVTTEAVQAVASALPLDEIEAHVEAMMACTTVETLQEAYRVAFAHAKTANDNLAKKRFDQVYAFHAENLRPKSQQEGLI